MKPSQTMGLYLTTWRTEWAGLSRAQLALLVSSQLHRPGRVTAPIVRQWEAGQPPKDLEELDALCQVMRQHRLLGVEVGHFRDAVFAACLDRHYKGLFTEDRLSPRAEVEELLDTRGNPVEMLSRLHTLTCYVQEPPLKPCPRPLLRRWQEARCRLLSGLAFWHRRAGRTHMAIARVRECGRILRSVFGPQGLDYGGSPAQMQLVELHHRIFGLNEPGAAELMLTLAYDLRDQGHRLHYANALCIALQALSNAQPPRLLYHQLRPQVEAALEIIQDSDPLWQGDSHYALCTALISHGELKLAETHLPFVEHIRPAAAAVYPWTRGQLAYAAGQYEEAQRHFAQAHALSLKREGDWVTGTSQQALEQCERAQHESRHRGKGRVVSSIAAGVH